MPPRKRAARGSLRNASTPTQDEDSIIAETPEESTVVSPTKPAFNLKDPWTDEQETSLFKGIIRWKPAGIHKHFRMIAISEHLRNHGYDHRSDPHTRIPGIWEKVGSLFNLDVINERENSFDYGEIPEEKYREFALPEDDFEDRMWEQGRLKDGSSSPVEAELPTKKRKRGDTVTKPRASTVDDTDDAKSSPAPSSAAPKGGRGGRRARGLVKADSSSRQASKDTVNETDAPTNDEDGDEDGEDEEDDGTPSPKAARTGRGSKAAASKSRAASTTRKSGRRR